MSLKYKTPSIRTLRCQMRKGAPVIGGVYVLIEKEEIIYIGSTQNFKTRLKQHKKNLLYKFDHHILIPVDWFYDGYSASNLEKRMIIEHKPRFNSIWNPDYEKEENKVWFTFINQFKSYKELAILSKTTMVKVKRILNKNFDGLTDVEINRVNEAVLTKWKPLHISCRKSKRMETTIN